jgi:hypothetical protein
MGADHITDMPWRDGFAVRLALAGLLLGVAGCAPLVHTPPPSPDGPARDADTDVTVGIVPQQSGIHYAHVPIEGEQGRRSNVLDGPRHVPPEWFESTCRDSARDPVELPTDLVVRVSLTASTARDCEPTLDHLRLRGTSAGACIRGPSVASLEP